MTPRALPAATLPIKSFRNSGEWRRWLLKRHATSTGIWLRFFKKASGRKTVSYSEARDEALCFGWIDGQVNKYDEASWLQKFTPRRSKSKWSKRNREHAARLVREKRMTPSGLKEITAARKDGRWGRAYDSPGSMKIPADFLRELKQNKKAYQFFKTLNKANTYAIAWRLQTARKPETREKRFKTLLAMLAAGKKLH